MTTFAPVTIASFALHSLLVVASVVVSWSAFIKLYNHARYGSDDGPSGVASHHKGAGAHGVSSSSMNGPGMRLSLWLRVFWFLTGMAERKEKKKEKQINK